MIVRGEWIKTADPVALASAAAYCCGRIEQALKIGKLRFTGKGWTCQLGPDTKIEFVPDDEPVEDGEKFRLLHELYMVVAAKGGHGWEWEWRELCEDLAPQLAESGLFFEDRFKTGRFVNGKGVLLRAEPGKYQARGCGCSTTVEFAKQEMFVGPLVRV